VLDTSPATDRLDQPEQRLPILPADIVPALPVRRSDDDGVDADGVRRGPAPTYVKPLAEPLTMPIMLIRERGVFVDDSGRRKLWMRTVGWVAAALSAAYVAVLGVTAISTAVGPQNTPAPAPAPATPQTSAPALPPPTTPPPTSPSPVVKKAPPKPVVKPVAPTKASVTPSATPTPTPSTSRTRSTTPTPTSITSTPSTTVT
jgi:hypothetical protein